jgi:hypothetical protein
MVAEASGALHPALYHCGLADAARRAGALLAEETPVDAITRRAGGFTLRTSRGVVEAREVIVATNGYTGTVTPWLRRRLIPLGSYIIATEPLPPETARRLIPRGRMIVDTNRVLSYYRLSPDGTRVLYGGRASFRRATAREAAPRLHAMMVSVWPELARTGVTHAWTGNVAFTFDHVPHMGVHEGVHYAAGCQGSGVAMATYLGHQTALKIAGKAVAPCAFDALPFPTRPTYTGDPWFLPVVGSYYRLQDARRRREPGIEHVGIDDLMAAREALPGRQFAGSLSGAHAKVGVHREPDRQHPEAGGGGASDRRDPAAAQHQQGDLLSLAGVRSQSFWESARIGATDS